MNRDNKKQGYTKPVYLFDNHEKRLNKIREYLLKEQQKHNDLVITPNYFNDSFMIRYCINYTYNNLINKPNQMHKED